MYRRLSGLALYLRLDSATHVAPACVGASQDGANHRADLASESARRMAELGERVAAPFLIGALLKLQAELGEPSEWLMDERVRSAVLVALQRVTGERYGPEPERWMAWLDADLPVGEWQGILG